jgi:hypothetical protein
MKHNMGQNWDGKQNQLTYVGEWLAVPPVDIFEADGRALEMRIDVYETEEERERERVIAEESPPRQQDGAEGRRLMDSLS